jgi:hypothetical protein
MDIKRLLISEIEKRDILRQYNLLTEDVVPISAINIDKNVNFAGGYYSEPYLLKDLGPEIEKIKNYLTAGNGKLFLVNVQISSGESRIPNTDNEKRPSVHVEPLVLATNRNKTITTYIKNQLQSFVDSKLLVNIPTFRFLPSVIGGTEWIGQPFCPKSLIPADDKQGYICTKSSFKPGNGADGKPIVNWVNGKNMVYKPILDTYLKEQFVNVKISLKELTEMKKCLDNMSIDVNYVGTTHTCNSAIYKIYIKGNLNKNSTLLLRNDGKNYASLNNEFSSPIMKEIPKLGEYDNNPKSVGGNRYNRFIITPEIATTLISDGSTSFIISVQCINPENNKDKRWGVGCHEGAGDVIVTNGNGIKIPYKDVKTPTGKDQTITLLPINACGEKLVK